MLQVAGKTDVGTVRGNNEDNFGYDTRFGIFVVCDGMGGQAAGERASKIAVDTILAFFRQDAKTRETQVVGRGFDGVSQRANLLAQAIQLANQSIHEEAANNLSQTGMGSTIVAVLAEDRFFSIANVGDSRIYLLRDGAMQQLTNDHSLVMEQVRRGLMTQEEAASSQMQNVIVRSLGVEESVEPDLEDHEFAPGDLLLLCSDGFSRFVQDSAMVDIISRGESLEKASEDLIEHAKSAGSDDNITCLLVRMVPESPGGRLLSALMPKRHRHKWSDSV